MNFSKMGLVRPWLLSLVALDCKVPGMICDGMFYETQAEIYAIIKQHFRSNTVCLQKGMLSPSYYVYNIFMSVITNET